jgi:hypothetical protein
MRSWKHRKKRRKSEALSFRPTGAIRRRTGESLPSDGQER